MLVVSEQYRKCTGLVSSPHNSRRYYQLGRVSGNRDKSSGIIFNEVDKPRHDDRDRQRQGEYYSLLFDVYR